MNHLKNSQNDANPVTHAAASRPPTWDDDPLLDHHIEEVLGAFSAVAPLGLHAPPDASA